MRWRRYLTTLAALLITVMGLAGITNLASASPHATFSPPKEGTKVTLGETSIDGPAIGRFDSQTVLAWTGSGTTSMWNINVQYTQHVPSWSDPGSTTTLGETAFSSPELVYNGASSTRQVLLAWTGTDALHHLNVADVYAAS